MDDSENPLIRGVESSDAAWAVLKAAVGSENGMGFRPYLNPLDTGYFGASEITLRDAFSSASAIFYADEETLKQERMPVLCIDPAGQCQSFRVYAKDLWLVDNNVSIGNLLLEEIVEAQVVDGVLVSPDGL